MHMFFYKIDDLIALNQLRDAGLRSRQSRPIHLQGFPDRVSQAGRPQAEVALHLGCNITMISHHI